MKPQEDKKLKFKMATKYPHNRSEGMTRRTNGGTYLQPKRWMMKKSTHEHYGGSPMNFLFCDGVICVVENGSGEIIVSHLNTEAEVRITPTREWLRVTAPRLVVGSYAGLSAVFAEGR